MEKIFLSKEGQLLKLTRLNFLRNCPNCELFDEIYVAAYNLDH